MDPCEDQNLQLRAGLPDALRIITREQSLCSQYKALPVGSEQSRVVSHFVPSENINFCLAHLGYLAKVLMPVSESPPQVRRAISILFLVPLLMQGIKFRSFFTKGCNSLLAMQPHVMLLALHSRTARGHAVCMPIFTDFELLPMWNV